jgi:hypothetical protein
LIGRQLGCQCTKGDCLFPGNLDSAGGIKCLTQDHQLLSGRQVGDQFIKGGRPLVLALDGAGGIKRLTQDC